MTAGRCTLRAATRLVVSEVVTVTAAGLALGVAGRLAASRFSTALLYQVRPFDIGSVGVPVVCVLVVCALAAVRATRVDPMTALRNE
jgi:putative ABC transport system permease protein